MARNAFSSHHRRKTKDLVVDEGDRISKLPDEILCHILSFLPKSRDAVQTSILSSRWRYIWTEVPCIVLHSRDADHGDMRRFADFVDKVLHLNKLSFLRKFSLYCSAAGRVHPSRFQQWLSNASLRHGGIEEFHLSFCYPSVLLPPRIFTMEKLVILELDCYGTLLDVPVSIYLPSVKIIHLKTVLLSNNDSIKYLLDGCPVIQELDITNCASLEELVINCGFDRLIIRSSSLKSLKVGGFVFENDDIEFRIVIETPNLERLDLKDDLSEKFDVNYLCSLVEVKLELDHQLAGSVGGDVYGNRIFELLGKMSNTECMTLAGNTAFYLGEHPRLDTPLTFQNLLYLELDHQDDEDGSWQVLPFLLECSPNLIYFGYDSFDNLPFRKPRCLMLNLEEIHLYDFQGLPNEMRWVRYFLKNAPVLKEISMSSSSKDESKILKKLSTLQRRSIGCLIKFRSSITDSTIHL